MASSSDYTKPTYTDMSHLCPIDAALTGGASMGAGNTVSGEPAVHGAPGSQPANPLPPGTENDVANLNISPLTSYVKKVGK